MMKGVSPLVASVLLIVITMSVAAVLATFVSSYTKSTLASLPTCVGGNIIYVTADYPKWDASTQKITAIVEAQNIPLGNFKFDVIFINDSATSFLDSQGLSLAAGATGTIISQPIGATKNDVKQVRVSTNCSNVKTDWTNLR